MNYKRPLIIFGVAAILLLLFFSLSRTKGNRYSWAETYDEESKNPYGTFIIYDLLQNYFSGKEVNKINTSISSDLPSDSLSQNDNYVFVGEGMYMDSADVQSLLHFVDHGNTAFISSKTIPYDLMFEIYYDECNNNYWDDYAMLKDTGAVFNLLHNDLESNEGYGYKYIHYRQIKKYNWTYIDSIYFCDETYSFVELGFLNDQQVNFAKKDYGQGAFYLHTSPIAFSNIQLMDQPGIDYAGKIFSHLPEGDIYWDRHSRVSVGVARRRNSQYSGNQTNREISGGGPLKYILSQAPLAWAWYICLSLAFLYLIFRAKRKQRIIPVLESNTNTSLDFISTIGTLYFIQSDHKKLSLQKMKLFLAYIRDRYYIPTGELDDVFVKKLVAKSEISEAVIQKIISTHTNIKGALSITEKTLIDFHQMIDQFYKNCK